MEFTTKPKNWQFSYSTEYENRPLKDGGFITWDNQKIVAVSKPNITAPEDALRFLESHDGAEVALKYFAERIEEA